MLSPSTVSASEVNKTSVVRPLSSSSACWLIVRFDPGCPLPQAIAADARSAATAIRAPLFAVLVMTASPSGQGRRCPGPYNEQAAGQPQSGSTCPISKEKSAGGILNDAHAHARVAHGGARIENGAAHEEGPALTWSAKGPRLRALLDQPGGGRRRSRCPPRPMASLLLGLLQVPQLVQLLFLLADHALALLDQLAHLLPALVADLRVEGGPARSAHGLSALSADLLVEGPAALLRDFHAAFAAGLCHGHATLLRIFRHRLPPVVGKDPPPLRLRPLLVSRSAPFTGCAS